jgi:CrcB protein
MSLVLAIGLVGGVGAVARFLLDGAVAERVAGEFPAGTFAVNITGSFLLGVLAGADVTGDALTIAATGFLGSYTTFSTWIFESERLGEDGEFRMLVLNLGVSLAAGLLAVWVGREIGGLL